MRDLSYILRNNFVQPLIYFYLSIFTKYMAKKHFDAFLLASLVRKRGKVVYFSGFARKINHLSSFCASEASANLTKLLFTRYLFVFCCLLMSCPKIGNELRLILSGLWIKSSSSPNRYP